MKKLFMLMSTILALVVSSCDYDDTAIWDKYNDLEGRVATLEKLCKEINSNVDALQTIVDALQNNDYVKSVTPITEGGKTIGYTITFGKSEPITIYHGQDGQDGANGADGKDGKDGYTPVIGIKQDTSGVYYWTVDGAWLLDEDGNKIRVQGLDGVNGEDGKDGADGKDGKDGQDGKDGKDGVTPQFKIENDYWYVSYDNGATWTELGKAKGEDGQDGKDGQDGQDGQGGDSLFRSVDTSNADYVIITLNDGTTIKLPTWHAFEALTELCNRMNANIEALQALLAAMESRDYITSCEPLIVEGVQVGYTITFAQGDSITLYHGEDGADGAKGEDGLDGHTPVIGVKIDVDGIYYWTVDGEWLLDENGDKVKASGSDANNGADGEDGKDGTDGEDGKDGQDGQDGQDGKDGKDGITPRLKIENDYWYVSYDNGATWTELGKAKGEDGQNGADGKDGQDGQDGKDGDSFFKSVTQDEYNVYFTLADDTVITIPIKPSADKVESVTFAPRYRDEKVAIDSKTKLAEFDFIITPKSAVEYIAENYKTALSMRAMHQETRAISLVDMPITDCYADLLQGVITITASGKELPEEFYVSNMLYSAILTVNDSVTSDFIKLVVVDSNGDVEEEEEEIIEGDDNIPNNIVYYTTTDEKILRLKNTNAFGSELISNTYTEGVGVITLKGNATIIAASAFEGCTTLATITIPDSVTTIGKSAFKGCTALKELNIPISVTSIGNNAFENCDALTEVVLPDSILTIGTSLFTGCDGLKKATVGKNIKVLSDNTFYNCKKMTQVTIGRNVTTIGKSAFYNCGLTSVTIPNSVTSIGGSAFSGCSSLTSITIPNSVTSIGDYAFYTCRSLTKVTIPNSVAWIGGYAFSGCSSLTSITIPNSMTSIEGSVFSGCNSLTSVTIPNSVTSIGGFAFNDCYSLTSVTIPESVTSIGGSAFQNCSSLTYVYCKATTPPSLGSNAFYYSSLRDIYVPYESLYDYVDTWGNYNFVGYDFETGEVVE